MIGSTNASSGGGTYSAGDFAFLVVTYPAGAEASVSNNAVEPVVITDDEGIGVCIFGIPSAGEWTVAVKNGDQTITQAVTFTIDEGGIIKNVTISEQSSLVELGVPSVGFTVHTKGSAVQGDGYYEIVAGGRQGVDPYAYNVEGAVCTTDAISFTGKSKVVLEGVFSGKILAIWDSTDETFTEATANATLALTSSMDGMAELDIPSGMESGRVGFVGRGTGNKIKVRNLYLSE